MTAAKGAAEVIERLESDAPPPLAVLDWALPETSGADICRHIRSLQKRRSTYVILLTRWSDGNDPLEALAAGADDCIFKPVDVRELRIRLQIGAQIILERALRESEDRFRGAFNASGVGIALMDHSGRLLQVNDALCRFLCVTPKDLVTTNFSAMFCPDDTPLETLLQQALAGQARDMEFEQRFFTRDGQLVWGALMVAVVGRDEGDAVTFLIQIRDIGKRKKAEQELKRTQAFARAITDGASDLIMIIEPNHRCAYASPSFRATLGYDPCELIGNDARSIVHPEDHETVNNAAFVLLRGELSLAAFVIRFRHKNGGWREIEVKGTLSRDQNGENEGFVVVGRSMEERIQAERELKQAHAETELLLDSIPSILVGFDSTGTISRWNPKAEQVFGLSSSQVVGRPIEDCGIRWLHSDMHAEVSRWLATQSTLRCDVLAFQHGSETRFVGLQIKRIRTDSNMEKLSYLVTGADITERKWLEEQLRQAQKMEAIGQLAAGIAHEINTPTQYVGDNIRFLQDCWPGILELLNLCQRIREQKGAEGVSAAAWEEFEEMRANLDLDYLTKNIPSAIDESLEGLGRVTKIVHAMKEFSHPGTEEKRGVDLNRAIETTLTVARNEWKYIANVVTNFDENLPPVPCIAGEMNQAFLNLIVNAAHAIAAVRTNGADHKGRISIKTQRADPWAEVAISDTGTGIPEEIQSRIFEPFFTTKPVGKGTGQGLALAHTVIVNHHQGQLWFESQLDHGSTFYVRIPLDATGSYL